MALRPVRAIPNFSSILDKPVTQISRPKPMPEGTYLFQVKGQPEMVKSKDKGTEGVKFTYLFVQAFGDVNEEALAAQGGIIDKSITNNSTTFWLTDKSDWRLLEFLAEVLEIPEVDEDAEADENGAYPPLSLRQMLAFVPNRQFYGVIKHESPKDRPNDVFMNVTNATSVTAMQEAADAAEQGAEFDEAS